MNRRRFVQSLASIGSTLAAGGARAGGEVPTRPRPNILLFTADDVSCDLACYGRPLTATPHLNGLAAEGVVFENAYTLTAICMPSRAQLMTGLYPHASGVTGFVPTRPDVQSLTAVLREHGYRTCLIGKSHLQPKEVYPFEEEHGIEETGDGRDPALFAQHVRHFLAAHDERPFFLMVNSADCHRPFPTQGVRDGPARQVAHPHEPTEAMRLPYLPGLPEIRAEIAQYCDALQRLDETVGAVLRELHAQEHARHTLVVFTSDNGAAFPLAKTTLYEEGLHMPFICRWPGVAPAGLRRRAMVAFIDVMPMCLEAAGIKCPAGLHGRSFLSVLRGESDHHRHAIVGSHTDHAGQRHFPMRSMRCGAWKYIRNFAPRIGFSNNAMNSRTWQAMVEGARTDPALAERVRRFQHRPPEELYHLAQDPHELVDLADHPAHASQKRQMRKGLRAFLGSIGDPLTDGV